MNSGWSWLVIVDRGSQWTTSNKNSWLWLWLKAIPSLGDCKLLRETRTVQWLMWADHFEPLREVTRARTVSKLRIRCLNTQHMRAVERWAVEPSNISWYLQRRWKHQLVVDQHRWERLSDVTQWLPLEIWSKTLMKHFPRFKLLEQGGPVAASKLLVILFGWDHFGSFCKDVAIGPLTVACIYAHSVACL